jgi:hypothetical protein
MCLTCDLALVTELASARADFNRYNVFEKELYNFESLHKFIQRAYTVF